MIITNQPMVEFSTLVEELSPRVLRHTLITYYIMAAKFVALTSYSKEV
jgi:hypothetical protein